jgi:hypothetical protein
MGSDGDGKRISERESARKSGELMGFEDTDHDRLVLYTFSL